MDQASSLEQQLLSFSMKDFTVFNLDGYSTIAKVLRIHDPDTMTIGFMYASKFYKTNVRLDGIDAPELHSKVANEAKLCRLGKEYLTKSYLNTIIKVEMGAMDKYGRILAKIYDKTTNECINNKLVSCKFVRAYGGNLHKDAWTSTEIDEGIQIANGMGIKDLSH